MRLALIGVVCAAACVASSAATAPTPAQPLRTGVVYAGDAAAGFFPRLKDAGATATRIAVHWSAVEPTLPVSPTDPADPAYQWSQTDALVRAANASGIAPVLLLFDAPRWAESGTPRANTAGGWNVDTDAFADFATAVTRHYAAGALRVRYWEAWNEPNITLYLAPQMRGGVDVAAETYRALVAGLATAAHSVHADNVVIAGGQSPFGKNYGFTNAMSPLSFMSDVLCTSARERSRASCRRPLSFDVWDHHPYTSGNAFHHAANANDVSIPDMPKMRALLDHAVAAGKVRAPHGVQLWVNEFSWDTKPPDPKGVPAALEARWVAEALHQLWLAGVTLVEWGQLVDSPRPNVVQGGLYYVNRKPKPALTAFRFPFTAYRSGSRVAVWGRVPPGKRRVVIEQKVGATWSRLGLLTAARTGVFQTSYAAPRATYLRARVVGGAQALPFSLHVPPDYPVNPFGS